MQVKNLLNDLPSSNDGEVIDPLIHSEQFTLERIISRGDATPPGEWYDQERHEWVVLLSGGATLRFEDSAELMTLMPGDWIDIRAHKKHRVEWTDPQVPTVWIALHYAGEEKTKVKTKE